jgi:hypothetical protein
MELGARVRQIGPAVGLVVLGLLAIRNVIGVANFALHRAMEGDFAQYYAFARIGLHDGWSRIYDLEAQRASWRAVGVLLWSPAIYPPPMGWFVAPFALLPFPTAYALWNLLLAVSLVTAWRLAASGGWRIRLGHLALALALPVIGHGLLLGQVVFVVAAVIAGVAWLMAKDRQILAGLLLTAIALKPQLAFLVPFALLATGRIKVFAAWVAGSMALLALAFMTLGAEGLQEYATRILHSADTVSSLYVPVGLTLPGLLGGGISAHAAQVAIVALVLFTAWHRREGQGGTFAITAGVVGSLLVTPFIHPQDLAVVLPAMWIYLRSAPPVAERATALAGMLAALLIATPFLLLLAIGAWLLPGRKPDFSPLKGEPWPASL